MKLCVLLLALSAPILSVACRSPGPVAGSGLRDAPVVPDAPGNNGGNVRVDEARKVLLITGKGTGSAGSKNLCAGECHGIDADKIKSWATKSVELDKCFEKAVADSQGNEKKAAEGKIICMKATPTAANYAVNKMGFLRAGAHLPAFEAIFKTALGEGTHQTEFKKFVKRMRMPPDEGEETVVVSPDDVSVLRQWSKEAVADGFQGLDDAFALDVGSATACTENVSTAMLDHVKVMKDEGWRFKHKSLGTVMFGCDAGRCFEAKGTDGNPRYPDVESTAFGKGWTPAGATYKLRVLRTLAGQSSYWMRSSADGRFVGNGGAVGEGDEGGSSLEDLLLKDRPRISVDAQYDPGFFPDNKGWTFHGAGGGEEYEDTQNGGAAFCSQRLLEDPTVKTVRPHKETRWCTLSALDVYQHVGASLDGGGYYVLRSDNYTNDNGAYDITRDPSVVSFSSPSAKVEIWPMQSAGDSFKVDQQPHVVAVPFEGDWSISPSNLVTASRIAAGSKQAGYRLRKFEGEAPNLKLTELATICIPGGKMSFSYDERFVMTHHYTDDSDWKDLGFASAADPEFKKLVGASSNIYVYDFVKRERTRLTNMKAGQFALYPHSRADNWIYFLVRDTNADKDHAVATNAVLELER